MAGGLETHIESLIALLNDPDRPRRVHASMLLCGMGPAAAPAVPRLVEMLGAGDARDRRLAAWTLGEIGVAEAIPALSGALNDEDEGVGRMAAEALKRIRLTGGQSKVA
jgi:HEAT repeat protein